MANNCFYDLKAYGKKDNIKELIQIMQYKHPKNIHFGRIFNADVVDEWELQNGNYAVWIYGDCAWSVHSCMFDDDYTYYKDNNGKNKNLSTILNEAIRLQLNIEIYSTEQGVGFAEHYLIKDGELEISDETSYHEYYYIDDIDEPFEEWKKNNHLPDDLTKDDLDDSLCYITGGFEPIFEVDNIPRKKR